MENNHDIDKKFNEASQSLEEPATFPGFDKVWAKVEEKLDNKEEKKKIIPIWFPYGIAASLIIGLGAFYFINKNDVSEIKKTAIAQNEVSPKVNSDVQIIDSTVKSNIEKEIHAQKDIQKPEVLVYESVVAIPEISPIYHNEMPSQNSNVTKDNVVYMEPNHDGVLDEEDKETKIEEVVMTGYRAVKKQSLTSSVTSINSTEIVNNRKSGSQGYVNSSPTIAMGNNSGFQYQNSSPNYDIRNEFKQSNNISQALIGTVSGLQITPNPGIPGSSQQITIRGISSLNA
ncbi:MAG TPA: VWA domain-containing protein, partial [Chryseobacterium sp.]